MLGFSVSSLGVAFPIWLSSRGPGFLGFRFGVAGLVVRGICMNKGR